MFRVQPGTVLGYLHDRAIPAPSGAYTGLSRALLMLGKPGEACKSGSMCHRTRPCHLRSPLQLPAATQKARIEIAKAGRGAAASTRREYSVSTLDFDARHGNLRTHAATPINQHAAEVHHRPTPCSTLDSQRRIWRA